MDTPSTSSPPCGPRGLIIAAPGTGAGKTIVTLGLLRAFSNRGRPMIPFKIGPDYIDPKYHEAASGRPCTNLDGWAMRPELLSRLIASAHEAMPGHEGAGFCLAEGVMGLFDGGLTAGLNGNGSTASMAAFTGWPVVLLIDCAGMGQSAGAIVRGFASHSPAIHVAGVLLNRVASPRHEKVLKSGLAGLDIPVLGCLPANPALRLPSRHLGLVQAAEHEDLECLIETAASLISRHCALEAIENLARPAAFSPPPAPFGVPPLGQHIAIARDAAFGFAYHHMLEHWRHEGATLSFFSPLANEGPARTADAIFLPGGYPELHAGTLAAAPDFFKSLRAAAQRGCVIYGECGGYMVLGQGLEDRQGHRHKMAGLLPLETSFARRRLHLGYRRLKCDRGFAGLLKGEGFTAHEFHYATIHSQSTAPPLFTCLDTGKPAGLCIGRTAGSFMHLIDSLPGKSSPS